MGLGCSGAGPITVRLSDKIVGCEATPTALHPSADKTVSSIDALQCMYEPPDKGNSAGTVNQNFFVIFQIKVQKPQVRDIFSYK